MKISSLPVNKKSFFLLSIISVFCLLLYLVAYPFPVSAQQGVVTIDNTVDVGPVLSVVQNNTSLVVVASDNNLDTNSWQNVGPFSVRA